MRMQTITAIEAVVIGVAIASAAAEEARRQDNSVIIGGRKGKRVCEGLIVVPD